MKGFILLIIGIILAILVIGGAAAFHFMNEMGIGIDEVNSDTINDIVDKVSNIQSSESSGSSSDGGSGNIIDDIVKEEVKFNAQNGEGYYREVTYKDGGFRQYDTETGDLIGSSYDSDQDKLPSME
ncbi:MAG: flagellar protein, FliL [Methanobrevibacter sp.]|nr:flagellar protein, FliL [Methanobrevibacter sp.]